jgi:D-alanyl-lipoteichoic acid acyltransferase DltB (MBOAT superfamily)
MLFNSFTYLLFLPLVVALHWLLPERCRRTLLLIASYVFYMNWMPAYGSLILALTVANYFFGLGIAKAARLKKPLLVAGLLFNLGCLCFFKYANFVLSSLWHSVLFIHQTANVPLMLDREPVLNVILPLGISFFTFEFIHYIVDVYRGSAPLRNFWHFALFAAFFPSQIAGPIKRYQDFNEQLHSQPRFSSQKFKEGVALIFLGLYKKMVLGDNLGHVVNAGFARPIEMGTLDAWLAAIGFTFQIYLDFSGYTDIGRGSALLLGYKLPDNFNWPFLAASLNEFWRRWHISLSTWLRDYLFIPLGGSRVSSWKIKRNLFITMALGGLWHGADWHYVIWGLFHGIGLVFTKDWIDFVDRTPWLKRLRPSALWHCCGVAFTFTFLIFACVIFRAENVPKALDVISRMFTIAPSAAVVQPFMRSTLPISAMIYCLYLLFERTLKKAPAMLSAPLRHAWNYLPLRIAAYACLGVAILGFSPEDVAPFIYFQF